MILYQTKLISVPKVILASTFASIHLEKYSRATAEKQRLPGVSGNGLTMSMPHGYSGQVGTMDLVGLAGEFCFLANFWHFLHVFTSCLASLVVEGQ